MRRCLVENVLAWCSVAKLAESFHGVGKLDGATRGLYGFVHRDADVAHMCGKALLVGYGDALLLALQYVEVGECGLVSVELVLGAEVIYATGEAQGVGHVAHHLVDPCDASVLSCGKA